MRVATVIVSENKILLIHRFFEDREYYVIPGGGREDGETIEQTAIREAKEETGLDVVLGKKLWELTNPKDGRQNVYFLVESFTGTLQLGGAEAENNSPSNSFTLEWHEVTEVPLLPIVPEIMKRLFVEAFCSKKI